jgi:hypothetical protein
MAQATPFSNSARQNDDATPARMAAAGIPFALARWYHLVGRNLRQHTEWDIERVMTVRWQVARFS